MVDFLWYPRPLFGEVSIPAFLASAALCVEPHAISFSNGPNVKIIRLSSYLLHADEYQLNL